MSQRGKKVSFSDTEIEVIFQDIFKSFSFDDLTYRKMTKYLWDEHFEAKQNHAKHRIKLKERMKELDSFISEA